MPNHPQATINASRHKPKDRFARYLLKPTHISVDEAQVPQNDHYGIDGRKLFLEVESEERQSDSRNAGRAQDHDRLGGLGDGDARWQTELQDRVLGVEKWHQPAKGQG
ncbi:hypothetical protein MMC17_003538 [Xylographa soralifera]|nr:hypothetical protein [Xylographa soralifera]